MDMAKILHTIAYNLENNKLLYNPNLEIEKSYSFQVDFTLFENMLEVGTVMLTVADSLEDLKNERSQDAIV